MPDIGDDALNGKQEYIEGEHTFTVGEQTLVIAKGMMITIIQPGASQASFHRTNTGPEGQPVSRGCKVKVYNANVEFK